MPCVACGSPDTAVCELLGHVYPITRENMHHARTQEPTPDQAIPARAPGVQLATVEHFRLTDPLFEFVEPRLGD
jgi:hypothetical protein